MPPSLDQFKAQLIGSRLMSQAEVETFAAALRRPPADAEQLARELVKRKKLTAYQAQQIYIGKGKTLVLGNYRVLDKLGQGGMGMVLKAEHQRMKRLVALKMLSPSVTRSPEARRRFQREVEAAARLRHPNIVAADDADEAHGLHFLVMEYIEGSDLSAWVKKHGVMPLEQALNCVVQAARGLEYAHRHGVVHRDIKPGNLLLDREGTVKVLDMGLARLATASENQDELTGTGQIMGTVDYMAPEQAVSTRQADARADIYSLGVTLWYLLTARPMYGGDSAMAKIMAHQNQPIPSLRAFCAAVSPALDAAFRKMVAKSPADRYQNMTELLAELEKCRTGDRSTPALASTAGEDTRLEAFLRDMSQASARVTSLPTPTLAAGATAAARVEPAVTVTLGQPQSDTNPQLPAPVLLGVARLAAAMPRSVRINAALRRTQAPVLVALTGGALVLLLGIWVIVRDKDGHEVARINMPADGPVEVGPLDEATIGFPNSADASARPSTSTPPPIAKAPFVDVEAKRHQQAWARHLGTTVETTNSLGAKLVLIPPGEFLMGSSDQQVEEAKISALLYDNESTRRRIELTERPQHQVTITRPFWLGATEITLGQFKQFVRARLYRTEAEVLKATPIGERPKPQASSVYRTRSGEIPTYLDPGYVVSDDSPAAAISFNDAVAFCRWLSDAERATYRLPTEAEWEYACRAGTTTQYWHGDSYADLHRHAWYNKNSDQRAHPVAMKLANAFGLFDMGGNVREWCQDFFDTDWYSTSLVVDPLQSKGGNNRLLRGGAADSYGPQCRSADRSNFTPSEPHPYAGFRVVREVPRN